MIRRFIEHFTRVCLMALAVSVVAGAPGARAIETQAKQAYLIDVATG